MLEYNIAYPLIFHTLYCLTILCMILKEMKYEERLKAVNIQSMAYIRARGDMIEAYKYTHGVYNSDQISLDDDNTRRVHEYKLKERFCKTATRQNFFRVTNAWNSLPSNGVNALSVKAF